MSVAVDEAGPHILGRSPGVDRFRALLHEEAAKLAALGDTSPLEERLARALGVLADRQAALDLSAGSQVTWCGWTSTD
ncbi:hypothetical protein [Nocardioides sp. SR21]|uniref:hypothetical protein n=1 Tax=Nocardioides sp. SR21 TaxID=2919501 RepID=UPI001FA962F6|nr:hypothetical protein [Nocardioides sp. SR21]